MEGESACKNGESAHSLQIVFFRYMIHDTCCVHFACESPFVIHTKYIPTVRF